MLTLANYIVDIKNQPLHSYYIQCGHSPLNVVISPIGVNTGFGTDEKGS